MFEKKIGIIPIVTDLGFLRQISHKTSRKEVDKRELVVAIKLALKTGWINGYGLAAVQLGVPIRAAWYWFPIDQHHPPKEVLLINPVILEKSNPIIIPGEGCLSLPNQTFNVRRYNTILLENEGEEKIEVTGKEAQIIQHEIDHMDGIIIIDSKYETKPGRNKPCPCGSGKKSKRCCYQ